MRRPQSPRSRMHRALVERLQIPQSCPLYFMSVMTRVGNFFKVSLQCNVILCHSLELFPPAADNDRTIPNKTIQTKPDRTFLRSFTAGRQLPKSRMSRIVRLRNAHALIAPQPRVCRETDPLSRNSPSAPDCPVIGEPFPLPSKPLTPRH